MKLLNKIMIRSQLLLTSSLSILKHRAKKPAQVVAFFKLLTSAFPLLKLLEEHRNHVLQSGSPLLLGDRGINESFFTLFSIKNLKQPKQ